MTMAEYISANFVRAI